MTKSDRKHTGSVVEKRGGYSSSTKLVTKLTPPPRGAAPGAKVAATSKPDTKAG